MDCSHNMASEPAEISPVPESERSLNQEPHTVVQNGVLETHFDDQLEHATTDEEYQGPHDWRKRLKPVKSPIHNRMKENVDEMDTAHSLGSRAIKDSRKVKDKFDEDSKAEKPRRIPSWKRHLIEKKKRGNTKLFRQGSGAGSSSSTAQASPGVYRKKSFKNNTTESTFTQQVVNNGISQSSSFKRRVSPSNSFNKNAQAVAVSSDLTKKRIERVQRARLYLLQQTGPNSFLIGGDSPDHKFRVIIGPQSCSCGKGPHCVHVLFVMLRVFQVSESDHCLSSKTLKNYEVENLFREYHNKVSLRIRNKELEIKHRNLKKAEVSGTPSPEHTPAPSEVGSVKEDDDTCPICLLEMLEGESLLKCDNGCQNRLHHHCIAVWFELCRRQNDPLICPLCRAKWKTNSVEVKSEAVVESVQTLVVPPNSRAQSPHTLPESETRLPYAEPIPSEYTEVSAPWVEVLGEDLVSCFFTRNWSIRESGLKHLTTEVVGVLMRGVGEGRSGAVISPVRQAATHRTLECCCQIVAFMCTDPVYKVYVASLRTLRTILSYSPCRDDSQRARLQAFLKPVVDAVIFKCTDGMRKTSQLSLSTIVELAKSQEGELAVGKQILSPGDTGLDGFNYVIKCVTEDYVPSDVTWQWLLGRLYVIEKLFDEFQNELLPRNPPEGKSGDETSSSIGLASACSEEPHSITSQERLLAIARFSVKAVTNSHMRICRMARRVFWLCARFSAHMDNIIEELERMVDQLESSIALAMKRRLIKIVSEFQLSEKLVHELHHGSSKSGKHFDDSAENSPGNTPVSTPRCNSPVTSQSDCQSEAGSFESKSEPAVPPNTPIRYRRRRKERRLIVKDLNEEELKNVVDVFIEEKVAKPKVKTVKELNPPEDEILASGSDHSIKKQQTPPPVPPRSRRGSMDLLTGESDLPPRPQMKRFNSCDITNNNAVDSSIVDDLVALSITKQDFSLPVKGAFNSSLRKLELSLPFGGNKPIEKSELKNESENCDEGLSDIACASPIVPENKLLEYMVNSEENRTPLSNPPKYDSTTEFQMYAHSSDERTLSSDDSLDRLTSRRRSKTRERFLTAEQGGMSSDEVLDTTPNSEIMSPTERPVTFQTEVAMPTPKSSPVHVTEHKDGEECHCKEEVEKEEALALAKAMEVSGVDPPKPIVPGLTPTDREEVVTIRIQPDDYDGRGQDNNGNPPKLYLENIHWVKGPLLGTGAYSTCYQARDVQTGVIMAVKQISFCRNSPTEQEQVIQTITEEIQMMAKLNHPHVVRILGATRQGCHFNMFNEWMPGGSLAYLLGQYGAFAESVTIPYTLQILRGLAYLHDNHILHRDLKGANLLVDSTGQRLRIGDFGAAARLASQATGAGEFQGQLLGTVAYMAPEVLRGEDYGRACDVWSVGCCVIEMATRNPPWDAKAISNHLALIFKIATSVTPPPIPEKLSPPLRDLLLRCLEQNKDDRPSAKDLLVHPLFTQYIPTKR